MDRCGFNKNALLLGLGARAALKETCKAASEPNDRTDEGYYEEPVRKLPIRRYDVVVACGGTGGIFSALAAAR